MRILLEEEKEQLQRNSEINREKLREARLQPCHDCGLRWHPAVMTLDHVGRKSSFKNKNAKTMSSILYYQPELFQRQLNLCQPVCKNCHFLREVKRDLDDVKFSKHHRDEWILWLDKCSKGALVDDK